MPTTPPSTGATPVPVQPAPTSSPTPRTGSPAALALRHELGDLVRLPSDADFDAVRTPWNVAVVQQPATADLPEDTTTSCRVLRLPPLPELPPFLSGRTVVVVDGAVLADDSTGAERMAALRALEPEVDAFARTPAAALTCPHMDPAGRHRPSAGRSRWTGWTRTPSTRSSPPSGRT